VDEELVQIIQGPVHQAAEQHGLQAGRGELEFAKDEILAWTPLVS
jgi:hypothetical protein